VSNAPEPKNNILLFLALGLTIFVVMNYFAPKPPKQQPAETGKQNQPSATNASVAAPPTEANNKTANMVATADLANSVESVTITTEMFKAVFSSRDGALNFYQLQNQYRTTDHTEENRLVLLDKAVCGSNLVFESIETMGATTLQLLGANYELVAYPENAKISGVKGKAPAVTAGNELVFRTIKGEWEVTKTYTFDDKTPYGFALSIGIRNLTQDAKNIRYRLCGINGLIPDENEGRWSAPVGVVAALPSPESTDAAVEHTTLTDLNENANTPFETKDDPRANIAWLGMTNRFFATVLLVDDPATTGKAILREHMITQEEAPEAYQPEFKVYPDSADVSLVSSQRLKVEPGQTLTQSFRFYGGPLQETSIAFDPRLSDITSYTVSWFAPISRLLLKALIFIADIVGNYGVALILLTILVKTLLHPLTRKALTSGQRMQKIQPLIKQLREKYKNDQARLQQETMRIWRENGVSPVGGCLPMLIQMPIFFALYGAFSRGFEFRQAMFIPGWIEDLSQQEKFVDLGINIPVMGQYLNLLPILYLGLQILQMHMQPKSDDPQMQQQQKMMKFMPIFFVLIFYAMPAGLVMYFAISSIYTLVETWLIRRAIDREHGTESVVATASTKKNSGKSK